jgi:CRP-like cAMP-binding protein
MRRATNRPDTRALRHIGLDAVMDRNQLEELALHTDVITVSRGEVLARAGASARQFVAVIDGLVDVTDSSGRTYVAGPGTHIGGGELLNRRPHDATFVTRSDCHLVVILGQALTSAFHHPGVANWAEQHQTVTRPGGESAAPDVSWALALVD